MIRTWMLLIVLVPSAAFAQVSGGINAVTFSRYSSALKLVSYDEKTNTYSFQGSITLTGTLFLVFDMAAPDRATGEIIEQKFVPDHTFVSQLPAVTGGSYPEPVRYLTLDVPIDRLETLFGGKEQYDHILHGNSHSISKRVTIMLSEYFTSVECGSRVYWGHVVSILSQIEPNKHVSRKLPKGC